MAHGIIITPEYGNGTFCLKFYYFKIRKAVKRYLVVNGFVLTIGSICFHKVIFKMIFKKCLG